MHLVSKVDCLTNEQYFYFSLMSSCKVGILPHWIQHILLLHSGRLKPCWKYHTWIEMYAQIRTDRRTDIMTDGRTDGQKEREGEREGERDLVVYWLHYFLLFFNGKTDWKNVKQTDGHINSQTDSTQESKQRWTDGQKDGQTNGWTDREKCMYGLHSFLFHFLA